jgi:ABC-type phosphate/phosphonate transport system substrate-binding protein
MKRTCLFMLIAAALFMGSCKSGGTDAEIATDMCGCFNKLKDSLPKEAIVVFEKAAAAEKPQETFAAERQKLDPETAQKINAALMGTARPGTPINDCLKELDKKYKTSMQSDQEAAKRMVAALKDKKDCDIMLALMRMSLKK